MGYSGSNNDDGYYLRRVYTTSTDLRLIHSKMSVCRSLSWIVTGWLKMQGSQKNIVEQENLGYNGFFALGPVCKPSTTDIFMLKEYLCGF